MQTILLFTIYGFTIASVLLPLYAVRTGKHGWAYFSAVLASPMCLYVAGYPALFYIPILFPFGILAGAVCIKKGRSGLALLFFAPYMILWVGIVITFAVNIG